MRTLISSFGAVCNYLSEKSKRIYKKKRKTLFLLIIVLPPKLYQHQNSSSTEACWTTSALSSQYQIFSPSRICNDQDDSQIHKSG